MRATPFPLRRSPSPSPPVPPLPFPLLPPARPFPLLSLSLSRLHRQELLSSAASLSSPPAASLPPDRRRRPFLSHSGDVYLPLSPASSPFVAWALRWQSPRSVEMIWRPSSLPPAAYPPEVAMARGAGGSDGGRISVAVAPLLAFLPGGSSAWRRDMEAAVRTA